MNILVTGGIGFIGSHTCVELLEQGNEVIVVDNLSNSKIEVLDKIKAITNKSVKFYELDILDKEEFEVVFKENKIDAVIHFAGLKAVGESCEKPIKYYQNNITGTLVLAELMEEYGVNKIVFSSSATVYGIPKAVPLTEEMPLNALNPYGATKLFCERILSDIQIANPTWSVVLLRYFNPIGAHSSGLLGEDPKGIPNNLLPYIAKVASGELEVLNVFGDDYDTPDGTGVRDYIHVVDLAKGHIKAIEQLKKETGTHIYNLGTGVGYSVFDIIHAFEKASGIKINYRVVERRPGDAAISYSDFSKANRELGWKAEKSIEDMCKDSWNFILKQKKL